MASTPPVLPPIKLEPESSQDSDLLPEDLAFNSDQDDGGSNIWDFTDENFSSESDQNSEQNEPNPLKDTFDFEEDIQKDQIRQEEIDDRFLNNNNPPNKPNKFQEDEKTMNSIFFQSIDWRKINNDFPYAIPGVKDFDVADGVRIPSLLHEPDPYKFFTEFLQDEFLDLIAFYTNQNASLDPRFRHPKKTPWKTVDKDDIRSFFGLLFLFGLMKKPNILSYWTKDPLIATECMPRIMELTKFSRIKRYICFYDKSQPKPVGDSFYKIRSFQDHVLSNSKRVYIPERDLSVDESIILYTGLHRLKVYMPQKPNRYGFKAFVLSEASTGFICNMMMSEGRLKGNSEESFTKRLVVDIMKDYQDQGYRVYMDRYYTSAELFMELKRKGIGACGTSLLTRLKLEKGLLKEVLEFKETDRSLFYTNESLMFTVWYHYKRQVHVISNFHDNSLTAVEKEKKLRKEIQVYKYDMPTMIRDYSYKMKGVDLFNQRMSYYSTNFRSMRWYFRIIYFYMEMAMINSYLVYTKIQVKNAWRPKNHADYRIHVLKRMVNWHGPDHLGPKINDFARNQLHMNPQDGGRQRFSPQLYDSRKLVFGSTIIDLPCEVERGKLSGVCSYCSPEGKPKHRTFWLCKQCRRHCCQGQCFLRHKVNRVLNTLLQANQGMEFVNTLLQTKKLKLIDNGQEIHKIQPINAREFQQKKQAILQYKRSSLLSGELAEEQSEKSLSITNIEEIKGQKDFLALDSDDSLLAARESIIKRNKMKKTNSDFHTEVKEINKQFPKRKGRPKGFKLPKKPLSDSSDDYEEERDFDNALKLSIRRKAGVESNKGFFSNLKDFYGLKDIEKPLENEQIFEEGKSSKEKFQLQHLNFQKPPVINVKKLFRYNSDKNSFGVYKSKLIKKEIPFKVVKPRGRKSRRDKCLDFLIMDLYKSNDIKTLLKNANGRWLDYSKLFKKDDINERDIDLEGFRLAKLEEEEEEEDENEDSFEFKPKKLNKKRLRDKKLLLEEEDEGEEEFKPNKKVFLTENKRKKEDEEINQFKSKKKIFLTNQKEKIDNDSDYSQNEDTELRDNKNNEKIIDKDNKKEKNSFWKQSYNALEAKEIESDDFVIELELETPDSPIKPRILSFTPIKKKIQKEKVKQRENEEIKEKAKKENYDKKKAKELEKTKKNEKTKEIEKLKEKSKEIVEIVEDSDDDVEIIEQNDQLQENKNIWLENSEGNKINFEYQFEDSLE